MLLRRRFLHDGFRCKTQALTSTIQNMVLHPENDASARFFSLKKQKNPLSLCGQTRYNRQAILQRAVPRRPPDWRTQCAVRQKKKETLMNKQKFFQGQRDGIPLGLGYFAVSFSVGISCHAASLMAFQSFLMSLLNNASAGEYGGITVISEDAGIWVIVLMTLIVNARYLLMSCALSQRLQPDTPLRLRLLVGFDVTDELFGIAIAQPGYLNVWYFFGAMCVALPAWSLGTLTGALAGSVLPQWAMGGFSVMLYGMFLAIIVPEGKKNRTVLGCILVSFAASLLAARLLPTLSEGMRILLLTVVISRRRPSCSRTESLRRRRSARSGRGTHAA